MNLGLDDYGMMGYTTKHCGRQFGVPSCAGVAELADALDLGSSARRAWEFKSLHPHQLLFKHSV